MDNTGYSIYKRIENYAIAIREDKKKMVVLYAKRKCRGEYTDDEYVYVSLPYDTDDETINVLLTDMYCWFKDDKLIARKDFPYKSIKEFKDSLLQLLGDEVFYRDITDIDCRFKNLFNDTEFDAYILREREREEAKKKKE